MYLSRGEESLGWVCRKHNILRKMEKEEPGKESEKVRSER